MTVSGPPSFPLDLLEPPDPGVLPLPHPARPAEGVRLLRGAVYAIPAGSRPLTVDLWLPADATGPVPVVVFVHGGGWRMGLRDDLGPRFRHWEPGPFARMAQEGFAVACPDYRLSGEAPHPAQTDDLAALLGWLHTRSADLGLDTARTVMWGESAGGHLAALTALTHHTRTDTAAVMGCVTWYAPTDLPALAEDFPEGVYDTRDPASFEALLVGGALADRPEAARDASPVTHVGPQAPPFLLLHGTDDVLVPTRQSVRLADALRQAGHDPDLRLLAGGNHLWLSLSEEDVSDCYARTLAFAHRCTAGG
ncbi:alpha/beta hydrolase fold domain-containing protein [Streptomyces sp. NPDC050535]|uniref:alpha/beta hydrolase fold domain-containing protein n=1 Tax=Streptomyces sp. NPDC050535 TaxID=3365626 RepID=UPI0037BDF4B9